MLANESKNMLENIEHVISDTVAAAEKTLGHSSPLSPNGSLPDYDKLNGVHSNGMNNGHMDEDMEMEEVDMEH
jgi:hypothetical protein